MHKPIDELHLDYEIEQEKILFDEEEPKTASKTHFFEKRLGSMKKPKIMNRIPDDAEASIVLVGEMNFLLGAGMKRSRNWRRHFNSNQVITSRQ